MVEFAFILPFLVVLIFGIIQFGTVFSAYLTLRNAAVVAVRYAALNPAPSEARVADFALHSIQPMLHPEHLRTPEIDLDATVAGVSGAKKVRLTYDVPLVVVGLIPGLGSEFSFPVSAETTMR